MDYHDEKKIAQVLVDEFGLIMLDLQHAMGENNFNELVQNTINDLTQPSKYQTDEEFKFAVMEAYGKNLERSLKE